MATPLSAAAPGTGVALAKAEFDFVHQVFVNNHPSTLDKAYPAFRQA